LYTIWQFVGPSILHKNMFMLGLIRYCSLLCQLRKASLTQSLINGFKIGAL
jgi:hypothetical protein